MSRPSSTALTVHLATYILRTEELATWFDGQVRLRLRAYLTDAMPPLEHITSSRCVVFQDQRIMVQRDTDGSHILPGGRREPGEGPEETVRREVLEESGWVIAEPVLLGFLHFRHITPKPEGYAYVYPDFLQVVYAANAVDFRADAILADGHVLESVFRDERNVRELMLPASQRLFLDAALDVRGSLSQ
jgi:ADP-ribose pyrophosphatase YjhB (NUDIX family)